MQAEELSYVIVTPYSMRKSRTGGIVSRLISRTGLDLVGGRMFAPGEELVRRYTEDDRDRESDPRHRATQELIRDYVRKNFTGERDGQRPRVLLLVFRGPDAIEKIRHVVGHIVHERTSGETIRDTYGDYITDEAGKVTYFEPGVLASLDAESVEENLKLWAEFSDSDGGILDDVITYPAGAKVEKTLVLIKPDNFKFPNIRPGGVIEVFSRTGLYIVGFKVHRMSVAQAEEFTGRCSRSCKTSSAPKKDARPGKTSWNSCPAAARARPATISVSRPAPRNASRSFTRAKTRCAKSATCSGRPIRARRRPARSARNLARRSWSTPRTPPTRPRTRNARWKSCRCARTT